MKPHSIIAVVDRAGQGGGGAVTRELQPRRSVEFAGTDDLIDFGTGLLTTGNFTVSAWVRTADLAASNGLWGMGDSYDTGYGFSTYVNSSGVIYALIVAGGTRVFAQKSGMTATAWHHVAITVDRAGSMTVFLNGVAGTPVSITGVSGSIANGSFVLGRYGTTPYYTGRMFDFQMFASSLTNSQINELKNYGPYGLSGTARTIWAKLDSQHPTLALDSSGNARHGTLSGVNASVGNFFYEGSDVPYSYQNSVGYTLDGAAYIPRDESDVTKDVDGNPLQFAGPFSHVSATGGTVTTDGAYTVHTFTSSGDFIASVGGDIEYLCVAGGGGGGGYASGVPGAGGGAGGLLVGSAAVVAGTIAIAVGAGGIGGVYTGPTPPASAGGNSSINGIATSIGGGRGATYGTGVPTVGGSGGGGTWGDAGAAGTPGQGYAGGTGQTVVASAGGGGGGAGGAGANAVSGGAGGVGVQSSISGTPTYYAGGGGGAKTGVGGLGGGGAGTGTGGVAGTANTGGGGGATGGVANAGAGGSGVVVIRYLT